MGPRPKGTRPKGRGSARRGRHPRSEAHACTTEEPVLAQRSCSHFASGLGLPA